MPKIFYRTLSISLLLGVSLMIGGVAFADVKGTNFEDFAAGDVNGQGGWTSGHGSSFCPVYDVEVTSSNLGYAGFGSKSLRISNAITCGSFNDMTFSPSLTDEAGETAAPTSTLSGGARQPHYEAEWDFASMVPNAAQPNLSVVASVDRGDTMRMTWLQMLDTADTSTGLTLNFEDYQHSIQNFVTTSIATHLDRTVPHHIKVTIDFIDGPGNDLVNVYLDGVLVHTGTTWEDYYRDFTSPPVPYAVDAMMFRTAGTAVPSTLGKGFLIDNFSSMSGPIGGPIVTPPVVVAPSASSPSVAPLINVRKVPSPSVLPNGPGTVTYTYSVTNPGRIPIKSVTLTDDQCPDVRFVSGDTNGDARLDLDETWTYTCTMVLTKTTVNYAVARGIGNDMEAIDTAIVEVVVGKTVEPTLIQISTIPDPMILPADGGLVTFTYTVTNPGTVPLTNVQVTDSSCDRIVFVSGDVNGDLLLQPSETWKFACQQYLSTTKTSSAVATGGASGMTATDVSLASVVMSPMNQLTNDAVTLSAQIAVMTSLGFNVHDLVKLQDDGNPLTQNDSTIYYFGADGKRHAFPSNHVYDSWYCDYTKVRVISADDLARIPLGKNVVYRPGLRLVKFPTSPVVYLVQPSRVLRPLADEATARSIGGSEWNMYVADISDAFYTDYTIGSVVTSADTSLLSSFLSLDQFPSAEMNILGYRDPGTASSLNCPVPVVRWPFTSIPQSFVFTHLLDRVSTFNQDTRYLQELLTFLGPAVYPEASVTGNYGTATFAAVKRFQTAHGLTATGAVGPATLRALNTVLGRYR